MNITSPKAEWLCTMCQGNASSPVGRCTRNREVSNALMAGDRQGIQRAGSSTFPYSVLQRLWKAPFIFIFCSWIFFSVGAFAGLSLLNSVVEHIRCWTWPRWSLEADPGMLPVEKARGGVVACPFPLCLLASSSLLFPGKWGTCEDGWPSVKQIELHLTEVV